MTSSKIIKAATIRKEVLKSRLIEPIGPFTVRLAEVRRDPVFQVRNKLVPDNIRRLRTVYQSGKKVEPILVAFVPGEELPFVIDGHHRYAALEALDAGTVEVMAIAASKRKARWLAAQANLAHGERLSTRELRAVFRAYITTRQHVLPEGRSQSYAEIGAAIGVKKSTVYHWMGKDYSKLRQQMGRDDVPSGPRERPPQAQPVVDRLGGVMAHLKGLRDEFEMSNSEDQQEALRMVGTMLAALREVHAATIEEEDPFR